jgi:uncharacterized FlaG/YvyC family protein
MASYQEEQRVDVPALNSATWTPLNGASAAPDTSSRGVVSAISAINQSGLWPGRELKVHMDVATQHLTIQVLNSETNEILSQIPSELVLQLASDLPKETQDTASQAWQ